MISAINAELALATVFRIWTRFSYPGCEDQTGHGTGLYVELLDGRVAFVTCRHLVDPTLYFSEYTPLKLTEIKLEVRGKMDGRPTPDTLSFAVANLDCVHLHRSADVAILVDPQARMPFSSPYYMRALERKEIADAAFLCNEAAILDVASFLGFPTVAGVVWLDEDWNSPIARTVNIASDPGRTFKHRQIETEDILLVTGLSLGGSSGSPVFIHEKGFRVSPPLSAPYSPARLIGLMSGHKDDGLLHSGLSYITRSTAILELLDQVDLQS